MKFIFIMLFLQVLLVALVFNFWLKIALSAVCGENWYELIELQNTFWCTDWKNNYEFIIQK